jgi:ribose 5-phosphate isomerase A
MANEQEKEAAARASLGFIKQGQIVGIGSGSTVAHFIRLLGEQVKMGLRLRGIPTSEHSRQEAARLGISLTTLDECQEIDVTVDGADEVDPQLRLIKGGGGALLREKIVASVSKRLVIIADSTKRVPVLGRFPLPVEVIKFAQAVVKTKIEAMGAQVSLRPAANGDPYVTDENNHILDCRFGKIDDPDRLARQLSDMPGVVEHGLFIGMASVVLVAEASKVVELKAGSK